MNNKNKWRILVTDIAWPSLDPEAKVLEEVGGELILAETGSETELLSLVPEAVAILTNWKKVPVSVVRAGRKLQVISRYGIGVDNIPVQEATKHGIIVTNVPTFCLDEVSDHAMALILACARKICFYNADVHAGRWNVASGDPIYRLRGQILGIIGFGNIGKVLAKKAIAFGLHMLVYDPNVDSKTVQMHSCEKTALDDLLIKSDFVSIHAALNNETRGLINEASLRRMKKNAYIINTSRGAVVDQDALKKAVQEGWIAGAALDVLVPEPLPVDHPLLRLPGVIITPHVAFYSQESVRDLEIKAAKNVATLLSGHRPDSIINPEVLKLPRWSHLR